jgi:outer membrane protein TolC
VAMAEMQAEDQLREVDRLLQVAWSRWSSAEQTHLISIQLTDNSRRSLEIALERLTSGAINSLDFREIQMQVINLQQQQLQTLNAWQAADIELQRLSGDWTIETQLP